MSYLYRHCGNRHIVRLRQSGLTILERDKAGMQTRQYATKSIDIQMKEVSPVDSGNCG